MPLSLGFLCAGCYWLGIPANLVFIATGKCIMVCIWWLIFPQYVYETPHIISQNGWVATDDRLHTGTQVHPCMLTRTLIRTYIHINTHMRMHAHSSLVNPHRGLVQQGVLTTPVSSHSILSSNSFTLAEFKPHYISWVQTVLSFFFSLLPSCSTSIQLPIPTTR